MKKDVIFASTDSGMEVSFSEEFIQKFAEIVSKRIAEELYYDLLIIKHLPEIEAIKQGKIEALKGEEAEKWLKERCE